MATGWTYGDLRETGLTEGRIRWRVENGALLRPYHGVFLPGDAHDELAALRALFLRLPASAALTRHSAARLYGFGDFVPVTRQVRVTLPAGVSRPEVGGIRVHESALPVEPVLVEGIPCVSPARCAIELARTCPRIDALPVLDGALRVGACDAAALTEEVLLHGGLPGVCQARELITLADAGAQCRQESQLRLVIVDGRLPRPETQVRVEDEGGWGRYFLDLGWRERRVGAEYDGSSHLDRQRARQDRERHNWLAAHGWRMRYFTDVDLYRRPRQLVSVLRAALT